MKLDVNRDLIEGHPDGVIQLSRDGCSTTTMPNPVTNSFKFSLTTHVSSNVEKVAAIRVHRGGCPQFQLPPVELPCEWQ